jgi:prephenate dehydrogenase
MSAAGGKKTFSRIAIIGTGAVGCSVACLAKGRGLAEEVVGIDRLPMHLEMAQRLGFIDRATDDPVRGTMGAQAVVMAVPLHQVFILAEKIGPHLRPDAAWTCTAGTTARVRKQITSAVTQGRLFVPSFPLVYTRGEGPAASSSELLSGGPCLVAEGEDYEEGVLDRVRSFWRDLGVETETLDAQRFELTVAAVHYWPQLLVTTIRKVASESSLMLGGSALGCWLDSIESAAEMEKSYQLHARRLAGLLVQLGREFDRLEKDFGFDPASTPIEGQADNGS